MRSAQRKERIEKGKTRTKLLGIFLRIVVPTLLALSVFIYLQLSTKYWNGKDKLIFAFHNQSGEVGISILDPKLNEQIDLLVPGDTQVSVARNYGTLRIKNVWQLGMNEKLGGELLSNTFTQSFLFPTNLWSDTDLSSVWKFIFSPKMTNISFGDRLAAGIFTLRLSGIDKTRIDLGTSQFLKKEILVDGKPGFVPSINVSERLTAFFADNDFSDKNLKFTITDATGNSLISQKVGAILEVLGGKVVEIEKRAKDSSFDCEVKGINKEAVKKISSLFECKKVSGNTSFDIELKIGGKFIERF